MAAKAKQVMLAETWDESIDPTGYIMSEKLGKMNEQLVITFRG